MKKKHISIAIAAITLICMGTILSGCTEEKKKAAKKAIEQDLPTPVIMIVIDTLRADRLSQYGHDLDTSPELKELASHSTRFSNCYTNAPWTRPAMTTLLTGLHPIKHSVTRKTSLSKDAVTMAESLKAAGMDTVAISLNPNVAKKTGLAQGFDVFEGMFGGKTLAYKDIKEMMRLARMWYHGGPKDSYFLFMVPMNVHGPYKVPKKKRKMLLGRKPAPGFKYYGKLMREIMKEGKALEKRAEVTPEHLVSLREKYDTAIRYSSYRVEKFFSFLKAEGYYDEAMIIVTADHGEELFDHGGFSHGFTLYDELLHVPLFVKLPFQKEGRVVEDRVTLTDIYPTVMDVLKLKQPEGIDGVSFADLLDGKPSEDKKPRPPEVFSVAWPKRCMGQAVMDWPWKLIKIEQNYEGVENATFLFNLETDPGEVKNLAPERPELVERLSREMKDGIKRYGGDKKYAETTKIDAEMEDRLKALGYLQ